MIRRRHFHVRSRELLLEAPQRCPFLPGLAMVGLALTEGEHHHIILEIASTTAADRFYLGPTQKQVQRRAQILAQALQQLPDIDAFHGSLIQEWVCTPWEVLIDELVEQLTAPL